MATPASAAPAGSYQQTCRDIQQHYGQSLTAECQTRDGSWIESRLDNADCRGDIANNDGRLVCVGDGGEQANRNDHMDNHDKYGDANRDGAYHDGARDQDQHDQYLRDRAQRDRDQRDRDAYAYNHPNDGAYGDRHDDRGYGDDILSRGQMVHRMEHQGYYAAHDLRPIGDERDWRALASYHGRRVVVRLNPHNGRVISARYIRR